MRLANVDQILHVSTTATAPPAQPRMLFFLAPRPPRNSGVQIKAWRSVITRQYPQEVTIYRLFTKTEHKQMFSLTEGKHVSPSLLSSFIFSRLSQKASLYGLDTEYPELDQKLLIRIGVLMQFIKTQTFQTNLSCLYRKNDVFGSSNLAFGRVLKGLLLAACEDVARKESENQANILVHANPPIPWVEFFSLDSPSQLFNCQIFTSWDSTIFASVFLILKAVSLEAGLWAQHSDISFKTARRH